MKNKRIIDSWNKIKPDSTADERMLTAILTRNSSGKSKKGKALIMNKRFNLKRLIPVVACLALVVAITAVIGNNTNWFSPDDNLDIYEARLSNGEVLNFHKAEAIGSGSVKYDFDVTSRTLSQDESGTLFGDLAVVTSYATYRSSDNSLIHVEGKTGETKVVFAAFGIPATDTVVDATAEESSINGVSVYAGCFITKANSQGIKNIIYFASFKLGETSVYVEIGGVESKGEALKSEISIVVEKLTLNGKSAKIEITDFAVSSETPYTFVGTLLEDCALGKSGDTVEVVCDDDTLFMGFSNLIAERKLSICYTDVFQASRPRINAVIMTNIASDAGAIM